MLVVLQQQNLSGTGGSSVDSSIASEQAQGSSATANRDIAATIQSAQAQGVQATAARQIAASAASGQAQSANAVAAVAGAPIDATVSSGQAQGVQAVAFNGVQIVPAGRSNDRYGLTLDAQIAQRAEQRATQIIASVAIKQAGGPEKTSKRKRQLQRELAQSGIEWNAFYGALLAQARSQALTEQIKAEFQNRQIEADILQAQIAQLVGEQIALKEDDEICALLLCM